MAASGIQHSLRTQCEELEQWLRDVKKIGLSGKCKACIYQHGILPRILWPLFLYKFLILNISDLERRVSHYLRSWLGLPRSLSITTLYGNTYKLRLPLKSIEKEFKALHAKEMLQFWESSNPEVSREGVAVKTDRKWRVEAAVEQARSWLLSWCPVARERSGLWLIATPCCDKVLGKEQKWLV